MNKLIATLTLFATLLLHTHSDLIPELSFKGPYDSITADGVRYINNFWEHGGEAKVLKHFVRLTPDRQSKKGYVWSKNPIGSNEFSAVLTFRISGQGKQWFGDGIGLWFTQNKNYVVGDNHGFTDKFVGLGIVIDTFHNPDHYGGHKDISILVNDGTKDLDALNSATKIGCDANIRYHEKHAAFDAVYSSSRIKVSVINNKLTVMLDEHNTGTWTECYNGDVPLPANWIQNSHVGTSAATGSLADNHDILRLDTFSLAVDPAHHVNDADTMIHNLGKQYEKWIDDENCKGDCKISILQKKLNDLQIDFEHKIADLKEKTENTVSKLRERESANEHKIEDLEKIVGGMVDKNLKNQMMYVGKQITSKIEETVHDKVVASSGGWKLPFFLLISGVGGGSFYLYKKYQQLRKSHLL